MGYLQPDKNEISLLYVEDEPVARELLQKIISRKFPAIKIHTAENGKMGLNLFKKIGPDIVLTDIDLPMLNGILMVSEIRRISPKAEIIILSGQGKESHESDCVKIGIGHYLEKPIVPKVLFDAIEDSLACLTS